MRRWLNIIQSPETLACPSDSDHLCKINDKRDTVGTVLFGLTCGGIETMDVSTIVKTHICCTLETDSLEFYGDWKHFIFSVNHKIFNTNSF